MEKTKKQKKKGKKNIGGGSDHKEKKLSAMTQTETKEYM